MSIGTAKHARGDYQGALEFYQRAAAILEANGKTDTNAGATLMYNTGVTMQKCGQLVDALHAFWQAHAIRKQKGTLDTPDGRQLCQNLEKAKQRLRENTNCGPNETPRGPSPARSCARSCA